MSGNMAIVKLHILVADDDKRIAASVRRALIHEGYDVSVVHDDVEALTRQRLRP